MRLLVTAGEGARAFVVAALDPDSLLATVADPTWATCGLAWTTGEAYEGGPVPADAVPVDRAAPRRPGPATAPELMAYAHQAHLDAEAAGTTWRGWSVIVDERALTRMLGERLAVIDGVRADTDSWLFGDGVARPVSNADLALLSQRMRRHIGVCLGVYNQVAAGITAGTVTTAAAIDAAFAGVGAIVLAGGA